MSFGGIVGVFQKKRFTWCSRSRSGLRYSTVNPLLLSSNAKTFFGYGGVGFFEKGDLFCLDRESQPLDFERVFVSFIR